MKKIIISFCLIFFALPVFSQKHNKTISQKELANFITQINEYKKNDADLRHAIWSVAVANANGGDIVYSYNSQYSLLPASNMKIITTGVGLLLLGSDYKFKTKLGYSGNITDSTLNGNLYIIGGGDPSLGSSIFKETEPNVVFAQFATALHNSGIRQINGRIIADTRIFDDVNRNGSWELNDVGTDYGAGSSGIQFMDNMCKLYIESAADISKKPNLLRIEPYIPNISWENYLTTTDSEDDGFDIYSSPYTDKALLLGTVTKNKKMKPFAAAIPNPAYTCAWYFNKYLNQNGIATSDKIEVRERKTHEIDNDEVTIIYTYLSPAYSDIINETNKNSNNCFAETILKTIGAQLGADGTTEEGSRIVDEKLKELGVDTNGFLQTDGSGLSRQDFVTTNFICKYLATMYNSTVYNTFVKSFPVAGVDGTMKYMLKKTAAENNVKAKSGSLTGVRSYSGYVTSKSGADLCFSFVVNNYTCKTSVITKKLEKLMLLLAEAN